MDAALMLAGVSGQCRPPPLPALSLTCHVSHFVLLSLVSMSCARRGSHLFPTHPAGAQLLAQLCINRGFTLTTAAKGSTIAVLQVRMGVNPNNVLRMGVNPKNVLRMSSVFHLHR